MNRSVAVVGTRGYPSYYGGFETLVRRLSPYLADNGWDVTVYGRHGATVPNDVNLDERVKSTCSRGLESKSLSTLSYGLTSSLMAARDRPDVVLIMNVANGYWLPILRARGIPTVLNVDGIEWEREKWGNLARFVFRSGAKMTAKFADYLVYDSRVLGERWRNEFGRSGSFIPYGGTDPGVLSPAFIPESGSYVLMVARFVPENTVLEFLAAAESISESCDVVIVGSSGYGGALDDSVRELADSNPRIHWLGHLSDDQKLFSLWQNANAYFHGHSVGGTNPALVQAMACGAPVVARDTPFNREVLADCAEYVDPEPESIARGVLRVINDRVLQSKLGSSGRLRATSDYSWDSVCEAYSSVLNAAVDAGKRSSGDQA